MKRLAEASLARDEGNSVLAAHCDEHVFAGDGRVVRRGADC